MYDTPTSSSHYSFRQLWLLDWENPLKSKIFDPIFKNIPKAGGLYIFRNKAKEVIYVGQSGNLRKRLFSYRYIHPDRNSRKEVRLVLSIEHIEWEIAPTHTSIRVLENKMIRKYRPKFNRANVFPERHTFITIETTPTEYRICWSRQEDTLNRNPGVERFGAFPGYSAPRGLVAIYRLHWAYLNPDSKLFDIPIIISRETAPKEFSWLNPTENESKRLLRKFKNFLKGDSPSLINRLSGKSGEVLARTGDPWLRKTLEQDKLQAEAFFNFAIKKHQRIRTTATRGRKYIISQTELDDLGVLDRVS